MRVPSSVHTSRPWRIHELTHGFRLEDVWELPAGGPDDFGQLVQTFASLDPSQTSCTVRGLFAIRTKLGELFRWDRPSTGVGARVPTLRERLPADLRDGPRGPDGAALPFRTLYLTDDEWAAEAANQTVHGVVHLSRVSVPIVGFRDYLAIYVKPNGVLGNAYMAAIKPFRYLVVYPSILRQLERTWRSERRATNGQEVLA
jgi:hypothetical protein